jgi:hypothetical protein
MKSGKSKAKIRAVGSEEPETREPKKEGTIILTGLKLEAEDGSGRSLELARCLDQTNYGAFFVEPGASGRAAPRTAYCPVCKRRHRTLRFVDAVEEGWAVLDEDNDCCLSPETLISGVIRLLQKRAAPAKESAS